MLLLLLGYTTVAYRVGRLVEGRFSLSFGSPYAAALVGVVALQIWDVLGNLFDLLPGPFGFFSVLISLFGVLVMIAAVIVGFGAVILARFGLEPGYWPRRGAPVTQAADPPQRGGSAAAERSADRSAGRAVGGARDLRARDAAIRHKKKRTPSGGRCRGRL